ncbi:MAG: glycosyltransferase, partial [Mycobacteriaceae bacterium]
MSTRNPLEVALPLGDGTWVVPGNRADLLDARTASPPPEVSVVIPYYREQARLDLVLTALADQTHPAGRLEVVIADDGSPRPPRVPPEAAGLRVTVVRQDDRGFRPAAARNLGVRAATGSVLCFLDGDTVPEPDYVHRASRLPSLLPDAVVTGRRRHADLSGWTPTRLQAWRRDGAPPPSELAEPAWLRELSVRLGSGPGGVTDSSFRAVISAVLTCGRSLFAEVGGFDETFTRYGGEDWELAHRLFTAGAVIAHEPRAVAWHDGPDWAGRVDDQVDATAQKAAEAAALAARVPEPALRRGTDPADLLVAPDVVVRARGADPATVHVLLGLGDVGVWTGPAARGVPAGSSDPRVHDGEPPAA